MYKAFAEMLKPPGYGLKPRALLTDNLRRWRRFMRSCLKGFTA